MLPYRLGKQIIIHSSSDCPGFIPPHAQGSSPHKRKVRMVHFSFSLGRAAGREFADEARVPLECRTFPKRTVHTTFWTGLGLPVTGKDFCVTFFNKWKKKGLQRSILWSQWENKEKKLKIKKSTCNFYFFLGPFEEPRFILYKPIKIKSFQKTLSHNVATEFQNKITYMDSSNFSRCKKELNMLWL